MNNNVSYSTAYILLMMFVVDPCYGYITINGNEIREEAVLGVFSSRDAAMYAASLDAERTHCTTLEWLTEGTESVTTWVDSIPEVTDIAYLKYTVRPMTVLDWNGAEAEFGNTLK